MVPQSSTFPQFSKLPLELRDLIWAYALPEPRVYEVLDSPCSSPLQASPACRLMFADVRNEPPPQMARVCQDARQAVLRRYKPLAFSGTVKHIDLTRDIILLDSYLQVRKLLKVLRMLSQIESIRRSASRIALGTSWGLHNGLHLRLFHKMVHTRKNMAKFLAYVLKFRQLRTIILVVYQRSAFHMRLRIPDHRTLPWQHYDLCEPYHFSFNINFNIDNYWLRRPYQTKLVRYDPATFKSEKTRLGLKDPKHSFHDALPHTCQVLDLMETFKTWLKLTAGDMATSHSILSTPKLETATLTWIYTASGGSNVG
ncbi:hypothetical protein F4780DRAFT_780393 [Xylariomycetidae sp. FL0641]|nr:hypothetical protein F4780DRAFT_780393 [Xylariomycetidae sp. FL0641]